MRAGRLLNRAAIVGIAGPTLLDAERRLFSDAPPAGIILFARNIRDHAQTRGLTASLRAAIPGVRVMVDQEGGCVARLRPPAFRAHPPAAALGALYARNWAAGIRTAWLTGASIGAECRAVGIDVVTAPVLDRAVAGAHSIIGDRAYAADPDVVATLGGAMAAGLMSAGVQPVMKHIPGHGRAEADSHVALPVVDAPDKVLIRDAEPFAACAGSIGWAMTAHVLYPAWDPDHPATISRTIIDTVIRGKLGFSGVLVSDDLAMHALSGTPGERAAAAIDAGCDLALHCSGVLADAAEVLAAVPCAPDADQLVDERDWLLR